MNALTAGLRVIPFFVLLAVPVFLTLRWRRRLLAAQSGGDGAAGWFGFTRAMRWMGAGFWFGWLGGVLLLDPWRGLSFALGWHWVGSAAFHNLMTILDWSCTPG